MEFKEASNYCKITYKTVTIFAFKSKEILVSEENLSRELHKYSVEKKAFDNKNMLVEAIKEGWNIISNETIEKTIHKVTRKQAIKVCITDGK